MRLLGVISIGEEPSDDESEDGLEALNGMLASWANDNLFVYVRTLDAITLIPGTAAYTVGPTGTTVSARPVDIDPSSYVAVNGISYPLQIATLQEYNAITLKQLTTSIPQALWYEPTFPDGTVTLFPVPQQAMTLNLWSFKQFKEYTDLTVETDLPPGYERAIAYSLAEEIAPEYEVLPSAQVVKTAMNARRMIKRTNFVPMLLSFRGDVLPGNGRFNIYSGLPA